MKFLLLDLTGFLLPFLLHSLCLFGDLGCHYLSPDIRIPVHAIFLCSPHVTALISSLARQTILPFPPLGEEGPSTRNNVEGSATHRLGPGKPATVLLSTAWVWAYLKARSRVWFMDRQTLQNICLDVVSSKIAGRTWLWLRSPGP